jgi:hypothetical protein
MDEPRMERRAERRVAANEPIVVAEVGQRRLHPKGGLLVEISKSSLTIKLPEAIACGAAMEVETADMLMLGEVIRCDPDGDGFRVALMLRHSLQDLPVLDNRASLGGNPPDARTAETDLPGYL